MWLWISLMTQRDSLHSLTQRIQTTNNKLQHHNMTGYKSSKVHSSPMKSYLYGQDTGNTSDYFSAGESQTGGYTSCPTTPLTTRRNGLETSQDLKKRETGNVSQSSRQTHRSNSSSRLYSDREVGSRQPLRSSSLNRIPRLEKLSAPRIVETEIWKKEIYQKVTEEFKEYKYPSKLTKSGSLPNLPHYISSVDIQVIPSRTIKFPGRENKQSQHEKEILKLCGDIITELKPAPVNIKLELQKDTDQSSYGKINKVCIKNQIEKPETTLETKSEADKFVSVKNVQIGPEPEQVPAKVCQGEKVSSSTESKFTERENIKPPNSFTSGGFFQDRISNEKRFEKYEKCDIYDRDSETDNEANYEEIDTESYVSSSSKHTFTISDDDGDYEGKPRSESKRPSFLKNYEDNNFGHFENLVNILQEAVNDISR